MNGSTEQISGGACSAKKSLMVGTLAVLLAGSLVIAGCGTKACASKASSNAPVSTPAPDAAR